MRLRIPNLSRPNEVPIVVETNTGSDVEVAGAHETNEKDNTQVHSKSEEDLVTPGFQHGVQAAQAINQVWTRQHLIAAYIIIWIINFIQGFGSGITGNDDCLLASTNSTNLYSKEH